VIDHELEDVLSTLPPHARAIVVDRLRRAGSRSPRLDERDALIRAIAERFYSDLDRRHRASAIARALDRELIRPATTADERRMALRNVLRLNKGRGLTRQQIGNVLAGERTPRRGQEIADNWPPVD